MKLQLTKTKTIEIHLPGGGGGAKGLPDVTGVLLNVDDPRGCPAVRLQRRKGAWQVAAAGFVPPPASPLPEAWDELGRQPTWALPPEFQAPHAALTVASAKALVRQTSPDALTLDLGDGATTTSSTTAEATPAKKKLGIRRDTTPKPVATEATKGAKALDSKSVVPGVPVSTLGMRFVTTPLAEAPFVLQSGLPEYQVLWLSRLLPEGKRPTAWSIQTQASSVLAAIGGQPLFTELGGNAFVVYMLKNAVYLAAYREGKLLMFRQCPGVAGWEMLREGVKLRLGIDDEMVDAILDDVIVDPRSAMEPFVRPVLQQIEISRDYLSSRHEMRLDRVFLMGLTSGARYWSQMAEEALHLPLVTPSVFEGCTVAAKDATALQELTPGASQVFLAPFGAARAVMEGNA